MKNDRSVLKISVRCVIFIVVTRRKSQGFSGWSKSYSLKGLVPNAMSENVLHLCPGIKRNN
jgi:hypothetical protein